MPVPLVYAEARPPAGSPVVSLGEDDLHHLRRVLRLDDGDRLLVSDGRGRVWSATLDAGRARLAGGPEHRPRLTPRLHVFQALPKRRKMDEVVRALTELGVERITPVAAARSVTQLDDRTQDRALSRWRRVATAAAAQARRAWLPEIRPVVDQNRAADSVTGQADAGTATGVVPHVGAATSLAAGVDRLAEAPALLAVAVGPAGGWTDDEVRRWHDAGLVPVTLGPTVLRTEHAALVACAAIAYARGRMS